VYQDAGEEVTAPAVEEAEEAEGGLPGVSQGDREIPKVEVLWWFEIVGLC